MAANGLSTDVADDPFGTFNVDETTFAGYFQLNLNGDIGGIEYVGDVGFRIVHTQVDISGFDAELRIQDFGGQSTAIFDELTIGDPTPFISNTTYTNVLPAFNIRFELSEDLYLRVAASETLTRPTFNNLSPGLSLNANCSCDVNDDNFALFAQAGNPSLDPYTSINYDVGLEWYFSDASSLYGAIFHKDIEDFIAVVTNNDVNTLGGNTIRAVGIEQDGSTNPINLDQLSQPANQGEAQVTGIELGYTHAFESGFGYNLNLTSVENTAEFTDSGQEIRFPGVSDTSYNITGFYESGPLEARLSYSYRSDFLVVPDAIGVPGSQIFADSYGQLDGGVSYNFDNFSVFVNALNLTDEGQSFTEVLAAGQEVFYSNAIVGRRLVVGVRGNFDF